VTSGCLREVAGDKIDAHVWSWLFGCLYTRVATSTAI